MNRFNAADYIRSPDSDREVVGAIITNPPAGPRAGALDAAGDADLELDSAAALDDDLHPDLLQHELGGAAPVLEPLHAVIPEQMAGERLDKALARLFPDYSRSRLQNWIEQGRVSVDGVPGRIRLAVEPGAQVIVAPAPSPETLAFTPEPVPLEIVYEDDALVVINKPAGLVVHPAAGNWSGTLLNGLLYRYGRAAAGLPRAGIVHRLDKDTSGLMVVARTLVAQTALVRQLQARTVKRGYLALVWGTPPAAGTIDAPIGRDPRDRLRMAVVEGASAKAARTHFTTAALGALDGRPTAALLCELETGRTHQIRVHCRHIGLPLIGDPQYGSGRATLRARPAGVQGAPTLSAAHGPIGRQALHAWRLGLIHPASGRAMSWRAAPPADVTTLAQLAGLSAALEFDAGVELADDEAEEAFDDVDIEAAVDIDDDPAFDGACDASDASDIPAAPGPLPDNGKPQ